MFNVTRRQALAASGGLLSTLLAPQRFAIAAASGTLNIAYNVNLPSFDPQVGPSSVNPTIQAIYRSVFDQYIGQKPNLSFEPGLITAWGWNDDKSKVWMDVRENVVWHDGTPVHAGRRRLVDPARRQAGRRQSGGRSSGPASTTSRSTASASPRDVKQYDPVLFKWMAFLTGYVLPKAYFEKVGAAGLREGSDRHRPVHGRRLRGQRISASQGAIPNIGAASPPSRPSCSSSSPMPTSRVAEIESGSSDVTLRNSLRRVRPAQGQGRP